MAVSLGGANQSTRASNVRAADKDVVGILFPFSKSGGEFPAKVRNIDCVTNDLLTLFKTPLRSRVMRPLSGSQAESVVFEAKGPLLNAMIQRMIRQTISQNEPRVVVLGLEIEDTGREVDVTIHYRVKGIKQEATVTLPKEGQGTGGS